MKLTTRTLTATLIAASAAVASFGLPAAAGSGVDKDALTLIQEANALTTDASMRFDLTMEMTGLPISLGDAPLITGSASGTDAEITMAMDALLAAGGVSADMFGLDDLDLHMRMIGSDMYVSGGLLQLMGQFDPSFTQFAELGDGWGLVDATKVSDLDAIISQMSGAANPADALAMLDGVERAEIIGTADVDGDTMTIVRITVSGETLAQVTGNANPLAQSDLSLPYDVYIDADGYPRQLVIHLDEETLAAADPSGSTGGLGMSMTMTMRFFDFNDPTIVIEAPTNAVDVTDDFVKMSTAGA